MQGVIGGPSVTFNPYPYAQNNPVNMVDPNGEFPWLLLGLFVAGSGIDLGFQMGIEGRSFDEVNWLRVGVAGGTTAIGGVFGKALHSASIGGRTAFAAGAIADFGVGVAADRYLLGDGWGTAVASNMIGFGFGEFVGYAGKGIARGIANSGFGQAAGRMAVNAGRTARNAAVDAAYAPLGMILGVGGGGFRAPRAGGNWDPSKWLTPQQFTILDSLGLSNSQMENFYKGNAVELRLPSTRINQDPSIRVDPVIATIQLQDTRLSASIISINNKSGGAVRDILRYRDRAFDLARAFELDDVELVGAAVVNDRIRRLVERQGFERVQRQVPPGIAEEYNVPSDFAIEVFVKVFPINYD